MHQFNLLIQHNASVNTAWIIDRTCLQVLREDVGEVKVTLNLVPQDL